MAGNHAVGDDLMSKTTKTAPAKPAQPSTTDSGRVVVGAGLMRF